MKIFQKNIRKKRFQPSQSAAPPPAPPPAPSLATPPAKVIPQPFQIENNKMLALSKIDMKNQKITSVANPSEAGDAVNLIYLQSYLNDRYMRKSDAQNVVLKQLGNPVEKTDACNKGYVDNAVAQIIKQKDQTQKVIYIPSQPNGIFSPGIVLKDVKITHIMFWTGQLQADRIRLFALIKIGTEKVERKELKINKSLEYEMNVNCEIHTTISFETSPAMTTPVSISLFYTDNVIENKL